MNKILVMLIVHVAVIFAAIYVYTQAIISNMPLMGLLFWQYLGLAVVISLLDTFILNTFK
jgi:hypothetical protein